MDAHKASVYYGLMEASKHKYLTVISAGPLVIVRLPLPNPPWRRLLAACTATMRQHGMKRKDITAIEHLAMDDYEAHLRASQPKWARKLPLLPGDLHYLQENEEVLPKIRAAFEGDGEHFAKFWLYDWKDDGLVLARRPTQ